VAGALALALAFSTRATAEVSPPVVADDSLVATVSRIYVGNDDHTDYMWTGTDLQYRTAFQNMLNYYMTQAEATAGNPSNARGRFNCDGSLWVWEYEHQRPAADFARLVGHLRDGSITMPLNTAVLVHGGMPAEAVLRNMYYAGRLERRLDLRFPLVLAMEDQTLPGGIASLWAGSGALYSWRGICHCATRINAAARPREIYHFRGPDGASVCLKWNSQDNGPASIGGYAEARDPFAAVNYVQTHQPFLARWPWSAAAAFGFGADDLQSTTTAFVDAALQLTNGSRQVIVSNEIDFFQDFLAAHAAEIPTFSGSFGNEWDLYIASMGEVSADFKRHVEKLRTAEALATIATLFDASFMNGRQSDRDSAFLACGLFYEHDWTADGPISKSARAQWQRRIKTALTRYVDELHDDALARLATLVHRPGAGERHVVFNPLSWSRTDFADLAVTTAAPRHVIDVTTGDEVPSQSVAVDGAPRLRILASDVPSVGYRVYEIVPGAAAALPPSASVTLPQMDNGRYRVRLGTDGSITSLVDHLDGDRELIDVGAGGSIHDLGSGSGTVTLESSGAVSTTLRVVAAGTPDHETRVTLYAGVDRIDVEGLVTENFGNVVSYRSSFELPGAVMRHEEVGMIAKVARAANGGDYADQNARTDYLTFNHFVDLSTAARGVTMSNWDSPFFGAGSSTVTTLDASPVIRAVVGMQVDGASLGIVNQDGDSRFLNRYALRTHGAYDQAAAMRFALEHQNPFVSAPVSGSAAVLPEDQWSLLSIDSPNVLLWALKPAEDGFDQGIVARVWNLSDTGESFALGMPSIGIADARQVTHIETDIGPATVAGGALTDALARQQIATYSLDPIVALGVRPRVALAGLSLACSPNPARGATETAITYALPAPARVRVTIHDVRGAIVRVLRNADQSAGSHRITWDGRAAGGARVAPGVYLVTIAASGDTRTGKIVRVD
jgi:alpha-mannosidase